MCHRQICRVVLSVNFCSSLYFLCSLEVHGGLVSIYVESSLFELLAGKS